MTNNHVFRIAVVGEDSSAVTHAQKLSRRLAAEFEPELTISNDSWTFEALDKMRLGRDAAREAAKADMIIIAASGAFELPANVKSWIESWLPRKRKGATALVAFCDCKGETPRESSPLCAYLRRIAGTWGMDFLTNSADRWQQDLEFTPQAPQRQQEISEPKKSESFLPDRAWRDYALNG